MIDGSSKIMAVLPLLWVIIPSFTKTWFGRGRSITKRLYLKCLWQTWGFNCVFDGMIGFLLSWKSRHHLASEGFHHFTFRVQFVMLNLLFFTKQFCDSVCISLANIYLSFEYLLQFEWKKNDVLAWVVQRLSCCSRCSGLLPGTTCWPSSTTTTVPKRGWLPWSSAFTPSSWSSSDSTSSSHSSSLHSTNNMFVHIWSNQTKHSVG